MQLTQLDDRSLRLAIERLRKDNVIINLQDGKGYFRTKNKAIIDRYINQENKRLKSIQRNIEVAKAELFALQMEQIRNEE